MNYIFLSSIEEAARQQRIVHQLFCLKRCFGPNTAIGILSPTGKVGSCKTIEELVVMGHAEPGLEWLDKFFVNIPSIASCSQDIMISDLPSDSLLEKSKQLQEVATVRASEKRQTARESHTVQCRCDKCGHIGWGLDGLKCGVLSICNGTMRIS